MHVDKTTIHEGFFSDSFPLFFKQAHNGEITCEKCVFVLVVIVTMTWLITSSEVKA